jgi:hypothetical protein
MSVTGSRAERSSSTIWKPEHPRRAGKTSAPNGPTASARTSISPRAARPTSIILVTDQGKTLAACKAKFEPLWPTPFVGLDRPRTVEEFNRLYLCHWPPEDDRDEDTRL